MLQLLLRSNAILSVFSPRIYIPHYCNHNLLAGVFSSLHYHIWNRSVSLSVWLHFWEGVATLHSIGSGWSTAYVDSTHTILRLECILTWVPVNFISLYISLQPYHSPSLSLSRSLSLSLSLFLSLSCLSACHSLGYDAVWIPIPHSSNHWSCLAVGIRLNPTKQDSLI